MFYRSLRLVALGVLGLAMLLSPATPTRADGRPILTLPTPRGETWEVIQGYNCGTHDGWGRLSFDIVNSDGRTRGAPVYAAADGTILYWGWQSGTLILSHGAGYFTMYTHMQSHIDAPVGTWVARGTQVGTVGAVNPTPTVPHLHFTFFYGDGPYGANRRPLPLAFADGEGYDFPDTGRCNQHAGALLVADGEEIVEVVDETPPTIEWSGVPAESWVNAGNVHWTVSDDQAVAGFSQAWNSEPEADEPEITDATEGLLELVEGGKHTAYVKAWDAAGNQTSVSREVWFDPMPPFFAQAAEADTDTQADDPDADPLKKTDASSGLVISWQAAEDELSGVDGYQLYFGPDPDGTSDWFVQETEVGLDPLGTGIYYFRVRALDRAGNFSEWTTIETFNVAE